MNALEAMKDLTDLSDDLRMFTTRQAAVVLDVSTETVRRWLRQGKIPYVRLTPGVQQGQLRIRRCDLRAWQQRMLTCSEHDTYKAR